MCAVLQALEDPTAQLHVSDARAKRDDMAQSSDALRGSASAAGSLAPSPSSEAADRPGVMGWLASGSKSGPLRPRSGASTPQPSLLDMEDVGATSLALLTTSNDGLQVSTPAGAQPPPLEAPVASTTAKAPVASSTATPTPAGTPAPATPTGTEPRAKAKGRPTDDGARLPAGAFRAVVLAVPYLEEFFGKRLPLTFFLSKGGTAPRPCAPSRAPLTLGPGGLRCQALGRQTLPPAWMPLRHVCRAWTPKKT